MKAKIHTNDFNRIVDATKQFAAKNTVSQIYEFIRLEFSAADSSVTAIATDGYRLSIEHSVCDCDEDFTAYINPATRLPRGMEAIIEIEKADRVDRLKCLGNAVVPAQFYPIFKGIAAIAALQGGEIGGN